MSAAICAVKTLNKGMPSIDGRYFDTLQAEPGALVKPAHTQQLQTL